MNHPLFKSGLAAGALLATFGFTLPAVATEGSLSPIGGVLQDAALTPPQRELGFVIEEICPPGAIPGSIPGRVPVTDADLQARCTEIVVGIAGSADISGAQEGLQAMAPEESAVVATTQVDSASGHQQGISNRQATVRAGGTPGALVYQNRNGISWNSAAAGEVTGNRWGFFLNGLYSFSDRDSTVNESGFEGDDYGVTGGIDYAFSDSFLLGLAIGWKTAEADIDFNGGELDTESYSIFGYWSYYGQNWYSDVMVGYTNNDHQQSRNLIYSIAGLTPGTTTSVNNTALSDTESDELSFNIAIGYNYYSGNWTLTPYARFDYANIEIDGFTETMAQANAPGSGLALIINDQEFDSVMATAGGTLATVWNAGIGPLFPYVTAEYVHEFENDNSPITGRFVSDPTGFTFALPTDSPDRNFFNIGAGITAELADNAYGYVRYQGLFGYTDLDVHAFEVGVRLTY